MRIVALTLLCLGLISGAVAQTVTVPGTFASLQAAIDSFRAGGSNAGTPNDNIIQVDAAALGAAGLDEDLAINDEAVPAAPYESMTIVGINGRPILRVQGDGPLDDSGLNPLLVPGGAFDINTDAANITLRNLTLVGSPTVEPVLHGLSLDRPKVSTGAQTILIDNVIITGPDAGGVPVVTDRASALLPSGPSVTVRFSIGDAIKLMYTDDCNTTVTVRDTIVSNYQQQDAVNPSFGDSCLEEDTGTSAGGTSVPFTLNVERCVFAQAHTGLYLVGFGNATPHTWVCNVTGADASESIFAYTGNYNMRTSFGGGAGDTCTGDLNIDHMITHWFGSNGVTARGYSGGGGMITNIDDWINNTPTLGAVYVFDPSDNGTFPVTWQNFTMHVPGSSGFFFVDTSPALEAPQQSTVMTVRNAIFSGAGGTGVYTQGSSGVIDIDFSALVTEGADALATETDKTNVPAGTLGDIIVGSNVIHANPIYRSRDNPLDLSYFDIGNAAYGGAGTAGSDLSGGADFDPVIITAVEGALYQNYR